MHEDLARAGVVGDAQACLVLDHLARSRTSTRRQRFVRDSGRLSTTRTRSPSWASLRSSWACSVVGRADDLLVAAVAPGDLDPHGDRLVGLVGDDDALAHLAVAAVACSAARRRRPARARPCAALALLLLAAAAARGGLAPARAASRSSAWRAAGGARRRSARPACSRPWAALGPCARARAPRPPAAASAASPRWPRSPASASAVSSVSGVSSAIRPSSCRCRSRAGGRRSAPARGRAWRCAGRRCSPARRWRAGSAARRARGAPRRRARAARCRRASRSSVAVVISCRPLA